MTLKQAKTFLEQHLYEDDYLINKQYSKRKLKHLYKRYQQPYPGHFKDISIAAKKIYDHLSSQSRSKKILS